MRKKMMEIARQIYIQQHGTAKGCGKILSFYSARSWRPNVAAFGGYKAAWNSTVLKDLRQSVGMFKEGE